MNGPYRIVSAGAPAALALLACAFLGAPGTLPARAAEPPPVRDGAADGGLEGLYFQDFIPKPNLEMFVSAASASLPYCTTCHPGGIVDRDEAQRALIEYNATLDSLVRMGDEAYDPENREMVEIRDAWAEQIRARAESDPLAKAMSGMALLQKTMPLQEELLREGFRLELFRVEDEIDFWLTRLRQHRLDQDWGQKAWEAWGSLPTPHRAHDGDPFQCVDPVTPVYRGRDTAYYSLLLEYLLRCRERYDTDAPEYDSLYVAQEIDKTRAKLDSVLYEHAYGEPGEIEPVSEA
ncbi:MAG: hypothetical protein FWE59_06990, partial [Oscillospiraceae bacterium]|nr:hypothetical protein [Oscillospiraceae bacterium]